MKQEMVFFKKKKQWELIFVEEFHLVKLEDEKEYFSRSKLLFL